MDLQSIDFLKLQSQLMKQDPTTKALCAALNPQFNKVAQEIIMCLIYSRIYSLEEPILDELAWQFKVDWYDAKADISAKREAIKSSIKIHKTRGTPSAVEEVVKIFFGGESTIEEWFEYGGQPYYFRIITAGAIPDPAKLEKFFEQINIVKNTRSWLEGITIDRQAIFNKYCGMIVTGCDTQIINTEIP